MSFYVYIIRNFFVYNSLQKYKIFDKKMIESKIVCRNFLIFENV